MGSDMKNSMSFLELRLYSDKKEKICLKFLPYLNKHVSKWEACHSYKCPLYVYFTDYRKLLAPYLACVFPLKHPLVGEIQECFDECFDNWIEKEAWCAIIKSIKLDLYKFEEKEKEFYYNFFKWIEEALLETNIIVVDGNL